MLFRSTDKCQLLFLWHRHNLFLHKPSSWHLSVPEVFFYQMILGKAIGNQNAFVILIELKRKLMVPAFLVFIDDDWEPCMEFTGAMHPHRALTSGSSVIVVHLGESHPTVSQEALTVPASCTLQGKVSLYCHGTDPLDGHHA